MTIGWPVVVGWVITGGGGFTQTAVPVAGGESSDSTTTPDISTVAVTTYLDSAPTGAVASVIVVWPALTEAKRSNGPPGSLAR